MNTQEKREWVARRAREFLGTPYKVSASPDDAPARVNCSTLVWYIFREIGIELKGKAIRQARNGVTVFPNVHSLEKGDLIFIKSARGFYDEIFPNGIGHVGIYVGDGKVISARKKQGMVVEEDVALYLDPKELRIIKRVIL